MSQYLSKTNLQLKIVDIVNISIMPQRLSKTNLQMKIENIVNISITPQRLPKVNLQLKIENIVNISITPQRLPKVNLQLKIENFQLFLDSSVVEHSAVNRRVVGSNPTRGVKTKTRSCFRCNSLI